MNKKLQIVKRLILLILAVVVISCSNIVKTTDGNAKETKESENTGTEKYTKMLT